MEHHNITLGFEGGSSEPRIRDETLGVDCYEFVVAHINVLKTESGGSPPGAPAGPTHRRRHWSTSGESALAQGGKITLEGETLPLEWHFSEWPPALPKGNLVKLCVCLSWAKKAALEAILTYTFPGELNPFTNNLSDGKWESLTTVLGLLMDAKAKPTKPVPGDDTEDLDQYLFFDYNYSCGPPCHDPKCRCVAKKIINIDINETTTEYTASDGTKVGLDPFSSYQTNVEKVVKAELAIKLDCAKGDPNPIGTSDHNI